MSESFFADRLGSSGDRLAAVDQSGSAISYRELAERADALAARLGSESRLILLEADNSIQWLIAYIGALRGRHPMIITPSGDQAIRERFEQQFQPAVRMIAANGYRPEALEGGGGWPLHPDLALLLSTSGSTGSLKCVRLSRRNIASNAAAISEYLGLDADERGAVNLPTHYSYGLSIVNSHLHAGATMLLTHHSAIDRHFWNFLNEHRATSFAGVPHVYDLLGRMDFVQSAPPSLRYFTQAGGRLPPDTALDFARIADRNGWRFFVMYGQTEATARIAYLPSDQALSHPDCVGISIPGGEIELIDENGATIGSPDVDGELVYSGPNVMMGYADDPGHLAAEPGPERLETGDLARRTEAGLLRVTGRKSRFIKIFGNRIGLDDVERLLAAEGHEAIATGIDDQLLVATREAGSANRISAQLKEQLSLPAAYFTVRELEEYPLLPSGKIDYARLKGTIEPAGEAAIAQTGGGHGGEDLRPGREQDIAKIWSDVLDVPSVKRHETFFDLGGDSLSAIAVMLRMESAGIPKSVTQQIFEGRSIAEIAAKAEGAQAGSAPALRAVTSEAINLTRGILVLIVVGAHWGPFVLERMGAVGAAIFAWTWPIFRIGTPGFAMVFGLGLGYFLAPLAKDHPARMKARLRTSLIIVAVGVVALGLLRAVELLLTQATLGPQWPTSMFYNVLTFYLLAVATAPPILRAIGGARYPVLAAVLLMVAGLAMSEMFSPLLQMEASGVVNLGRLMLSANYSYPLMLSYVLIGMAIGLWILRNNDRADLARVCLWAGSALFFGGIVLSLGTGLGARWFVGIPTQPAIVTYAGAILLIFSAAFHLLGEKGHRKLAIYRLLIVTGILAFPVYVGHTAALQVKEILEALHVPYALAVGLPVALFALLFGIAMQRIYRLYYG